KLHGDSKERKGVTRADVTWDTCCHLDLRPQIAILDRRRLTPISWAPRSEVTAPRGRISETARCTGGGAHVPPDPGPSGRRPCGAPLRAPQAARRRARSARHR